jgi:hypothetical protein
MIVKCTFDQLENFLLHTYNKEYFRDKYEWDDFGWDVEDKKWEFAQDGIYLPFDTTQEMISKMGLYYMSPSYPDLYLFDEEEINRGDTDADIDEASISIIRNLNDVEKCITLDSKDRICFKMGFSCWISEAYTIVAKEIV